MAQLHLKWVVLATKITFLSSSRGGRILRLDRTAFSFKNDMGRLFRLYIYMKRWKALGGRVVGVGSHIFL